MLINRRRCADTLTGSASELMGDIDSALNAYERALNHNHQSITAMNAISCILRTKEQFAKAVDYLQAIIRLDASNGEVWGSLGKHMPSSNLVRGLTNLQDTAI